MHASERMIESASGAEVVLRDGRRLVSFAGCDSLGLARHPDVVAVARDALSRHGISAAASRTTTGTWVEHLQLETALATYMGEEDCVVFPSGWLACQSALRAVSIGSHAVVVDRDAHPGVMDGVALMRRPVSEYARFDVADATRALEPLVGARPVVVTCTVDLASGTVAPLDGLAAAAAEVSGVLLVDDAHGVGVLGEHGRGAAEHCGATGAHVVVTGTLSKAFGAQGGFVVGSHARCDAVRERAPAFAGATPLPPALAAAARRAVEIAATGAPRARLRAVCARARDGFTALGMPVPPEPVPWLAIQGSDAAALREREDALAEHGFLAPHVSYHGAPPAGYIRIALSAAHTDEHVDGLLAAIAATTRRLPSAP